MRTVHLIRHASYSMLDQGLAGRADGFPLDEVGRGQAASLGPVFLDRDLSCVVSSPRQRTCETAAALGRPVTVDAGFDEIDVGGWTGLTFEALRLDPLWHCWNRARAITRCPGGETMLEAQARAVAALWRLPDGESVVVSHSDIIKALLAHCLGMPLDLIGRLEIAPASRSIVLLFDDAVRVDLINQPPLVG